MTSIKRKPRPFKVALFCAVMAMNAGSVLAESGSAGGSIGNDEKSLSGSREAKPTQSPSHEKPEVHHGAGAGIIAVRSHCPITGATGIGRGSTLETARTAAIEACISRGGVPVCCQKHADRI